MVTAFCGRYRCVADCIRVGCELIGRRSVEIKFLQIDISTYCTVFTLHSCDVFVIYLDV